jgi:hypothetical protein
MAGGQSDNDKRQPLWEHGGYNTQAPLYQWTARLVAARKMMLKSLSAVSIDVLSALQVTPDGNVLGFVRGNALAVMCKRGYSGSATVATSFRSGTQLCAALAPSTAGTLLSASSHASCNNGTSNRQDCGHSGTQQPECEAAGCCWSPVQPNPGSVPWCFHSSNPPGPPPPPAPPGPPPSSKCVSVGQDGSVQVQLNAGLPEVYIVKGSHF